MFSWFWMEPADAWPLASVTVNSGAAQALPPEPDDADRSTTRSAQPLILGGVRRVTTGSARESGAVINTVDTTAVSQPAHTVEA